MLIFSRFDIYSLDKSAKQDEDGIQSAAAESEELRTSFLQDMDLLVS